MGRYFGTDGFRGEANVDLTADHAYQVGRFLGWYYGELKRRAGDETPVRVVIGKDTRRSSYMFEYALASGLVASGADAYLLHVTTTPSVSYVARTETFDCGIMIWTAGWRCSARCGSRFRWPSGSASAARWTIPPGATGM